MAVDKGGIVCEESIASIFEYQKNQPDFDFRFAQLYNATKTIV
jgi:hypothetical protein